MKNRAVQAAQYGGSIDRVSINRGGGMKEVNKYIESCNSHVFAP